MSNLRSASNPSSPDAPRTSALLADLIRAHRPLLIEIADRARPKGEIDLSFDAEDIVDDVCVEVLEGKLALSVDRATALRELMRAIRRRARDSP
jgi:hypothetical protein